MTALTELSTIEISQLAAPFEITPNAIVKNRFFKSAMSETLGEISGRPQEGLVTLFGRWAQGGAGLLVTGNIMVDSRALGEPGNVVVEGDRDLDILERWAQAGTANGTHLWPQLNHPGRQAPRRLNAETVAPSAVPFSPTLKMAFETPRELRAEEILDIIQRFATTAGVLKRAGFTGIQIHGAHGYLVSQFLSPIYNRRQDEWGGDIHGRMRLVMEIYKAIRAEVGDDFPIGIKLNSADFQKGGFSEEESLMVIKALSEAGINAIEISGGNYEAPALFFGDKMKESTKIREAYFLDFAEKVRKESNVALTVTGGFRSRSGMASALVEGNLDFVGIARPVAVDPDFPNKILSGNISAIKIRNLKTYIPLVDNSGMAELAWYHLQMHRTASGKVTKPKEYPMISLIKNMTAAGVSGFKFSRLRE